MLTRIRNIEKDGGKAEFTFDHEGRILFVKKATRPKVSVQRYLSVQNDQNQRKS